MVTQRYVTDAVANFRILTAWIGDDKEKFEKKKNGLESFAVVCFCMEDVAIKFRSKRCGNLMLVIWTCRIWPFVKNVLIGFSIWAVNFLN